MLRAAFLTLSLLAALALAPAAALGAALPPVGPSGQFVPSLGDRDGDGLPDATDCAPDDPSRPARAGVDANCDGQPDAGVGPIVITGPADGGPDGSEQAASSPSSPAVRPAAVARRAAGTAVARLRWPLGSSLAVFAGRGPSQGTRTFVFVARDNAGLTVTHRLDHGRTATHRRSLARGGAYVLRVAVGSARRLRMAVTVVDASGNRRRVARTLTLRP